MSRDKLYLGTSYFVLNRWSFVEMKLYVHSVLKAQEANSPGICITQNRLFCEYGLMSKYKCWYSINITKICLSVSQPSELPETSRWAGGKLIFLQKTILILFINYILDIPRHVYPLAHKVTLAKKMRCVSIQEIEFIERNRCIMLWCSVCWAFLGYQFQKTMHLHL